MSQNNTSNSRHRAFMFCRGGSKGVKDKNIRMVGGKPLLVHSVETALSCPSIAEVVVSTDSPRIAEVARAAGASVLDRPAELAADASPELLSWRHAIEALPPLSDLFISVPATVPLRLPEDIEAGIAAYGQGDHDIIFSVTPSDASPYLTMVTRDEDGTVDVVIPGHSAVRRQEVPQTFDLTACVYVTSRDYVMSCERLMSGRAGSILIPPERALDIDTEYDLHLANLLLRHPFESPQE